MPYINLEFVIGRRLAVTACSAVLCAVGLLAFAAGPASAADSFSCRGSAVRLTGLGIVNLEPSVANTAGTPCVSESKSVATLPAPLSSLLGLSAATAQTTASATGVTAHSGVVNPVFVGLLGGITVQALTADASDQCVSGTPSATGHSQVVGLSVGGKSYGTINSPTTINVPGLGTLYLNETVTGNGSLAQRALELQLLPNVDGGVDLVLGEATVGAAGNPCNPGTTPPGTNPPGTNPPPGGVNVCPAGSVLVPGADLCEIILPGGGTIIISRPFEGPTGGTVISLSQARKKYHSACLYGAGPQYAIVGTNGPDRINGTRRTERILGLGGNDRISAGGGNDCIDGGSGNDRVYGGNGSDRVYGGSGADRLSVQNGSSYVNGGSGNDRIFLGNGNDRVYGGSGNDRISVGRGRDRVWGDAGSDTISMGNGNDSVWGGAGNDTIYVGTGKDHLYGGSGNDRLFGPGLVVYANCGSGSHNAAFVNIFGMHYAKMHGCQKVRKIHTHVL